MAGDLEIEGRVVRLRVLLEFIVPESAVLIGPEGAVLIVSEGEAYLPGLGDFDDLLAALRRIARKAFDPTRVHVDAEIALENGREVVVDIATEGLVTIETGAIVAALNEISRAMPSRIRDYVQEELIPPDTTVRVDETRVELGSGTLEASAGDQPAPPPEQTVTEKLAEKLNPILASAVIVLLVTLIVVLVV
jgi:hypothetical protein